MSTELIVRPHLRLTDIPGLRVAAIAAEQTFSDACCSIKEHVIQETKSVGAHLATLQRTDLLAYIREVDGGDIIAPLIDEQYDVNIEYDPNSQAESRDRFYSRDCSTAFAPEKLCPSDFNTTKASVSLTFRDSEGKPRKATLTFSYYNYETGEELSPPHRTFVYREYQGGKVYTFPPRKDQVPHGPHFYCQVRRDSGRGSLGVEKSVDSCSSWDTLYNIRVAAKPAPKSSKDVADLKARLTEVEAKLKALSAPPQETK